MSLSLAEMQGGHGKQDYPDNYLEPRPGQFSKKVIASNNSQNIAQKSPKSHQKVSQKLVQKEPQQSPKSHPKRTKKL